jgi:hypothetical protein
LIRLKFEGFLQKKKLGLAPGLDCGLISVKFEGFFTKKKKPKSRHELRVDSTEVRGFFLKKDRRKHDLGRS